MRRSRETVGIRNGFGRPRLSIHVTGEGQPSAVNLRFDAAQALKEIGNASVEPLIALLRNSNEFVSQDAIVTLGAIGDARAVEPLISALQNSARGVRVGSAEALGRIGDERAVEPLVEALKNSDRYMGLVIVEALEKLMVDHESVENRNL